MSRSLFALGAAALGALAACDAAPQLSETDDFAPELSETDEALTSVTQAITDASSAAGGSVLEVTRELLGGDVYHYGFVVRVGDTANAKLHLHRVVRERTPWRPHATAGAAMLLHGDFGTFATSFAPTLGTPPSTASGMAVYLAQRGLDIWGFDRRWTQASAEGADLSDFGDMGMAAEIDDIGRALAFVRAVRVATGAGADRLTLVGFSRGGQLAYAYTAQEAGRPGWQRHVKALVPLDVYAELSPADDALRQSACIRRDKARADLDSGVVDAPNGFLIDTGARALTAPDDPSPTFPGMTNRGALFTVLGQTYFFFQPVPVYHLAAPVLEGDVVTALRESPEDVTATWFAGATPHQSLREVAEGDALWCGEAPLPVAVALDRIRVPFFYLGAAGGFGDHGLYSTTRVGSTDVTTLVVRRFGADREAEDFGHGDLLYAGDAPTLAWQPLASWILQH